MSNHSQCVSSFKDSSEDNHEFTLTYTMKQTLFIYSFALVAATTFAQAQSNTAAIKANLIERTFSLSEETKPFKKQLATIAKDPYNGDQMINETFQRLTLSKAEQTKLLASQNDDGSWPDLDYNDQQRSGWQPRIHATRLLALTQASFAANGKEQAKLYKAILKGLRYYHGIDPKCPNWWYNEIGIPKTLGPVYLVMKDQMTEADLAKALEIMRRSQIKMTGQNKVWLAGNTLMRALIEENEPLIKQARDTIAAEIRVGEAEGIKSDYSFHQHGPMLQFGNYGLAYIANMAFWSAVFKDGDHAFDQSQQEALRKLMLEGFAHVNYNGYLDVNAYGRQFGKDVSRVKYLALAFSACDLIDADPDHAAQYKQFLDSNNPVNTKPTPAYTAQNKGSWHPNQAKGNSVERKKNERNQSPFSNGNASNTEKGFGGVRYYPTSDFVTFRGNDWSTSLKMVSDRIFGSESVNGDNKLGYNLSDGALMVYVHGDEYENVFPCWNWSEIPGTTTYQRNNKLPQLTMSNYQVQSAFAGCASDSLGGVAAMILNRDSLFARKAWFFLDNKVVCLGADIRTQRNLPLVTTIQQCNGREVQQGNTPEQMSAPKSSADQASQDQYITHNDLLYTNLDRQQWELFLGEKQGNWHDVMDFYPDEPIATRVFSLTIPHKEANATYAYAIEPTQYKASNREIQVERNDATAQVVTTITGEWMGIVAYEPCEIRLSSGKSIHFHQPSIAMIAEGEGGVQMRLSDPFQSLKTMQYTYDGKKKVVSMQDVAIPGTAVAVKL